MLITAVVRDDELDNVTRAVINEGARGMTVTEVRGFGRQFGSVVGESPAPRLGVLLHKLRVDLVVRDQEAAAVAAAIAKAARTGDRQAG
jgi:nitrogen regulatory protein P-II 1